MRLFSVFLCLLLISGCNSLKHSDYYYNEITVVNKSSSNINDVVIGVEKTQGVFRCSFIPAGADCSNSFRKRKYLGNAVQVSWIQANQKRSTEKFTLTVPEGIDDSIPMRGVLEINDKGFYQSYLEQKAVNKTGF